MTSMQHFARIVNGRAGYFVAGVLVCLIIVWAASIFHPAQLSNVYESDQAYTFINPLLSCADAEYSPLAIDRKEELRDRVTGMVKKLQSDGTINDAGIYFRELHDGPWFGVNETEEFTPGSLLKIPLAMSVYNAAEDDPSLFSKTLTYTGGAQPEEYFKAPVIEAGKSYTVAQLVRAMLVNSDNSAAFLLADSIGMDNFDETFARLGIEKPTNGQDYTTTVQGYAAFFRVLYTATYLDRKASEEVLATLSQSLFTQGIVAGVPKGIVVAHKFGERSFQNSTAVQLHDCGIVYVPGNPYLICIMMRGNDFHTLAKSIAEISSLVYTYAR